MYGTRVKDLLRRAGRAFVYGEKGKQYTIIFDEDGAIPLDGKGRRIKPIPYEVFDKIEDYLNEGGGTLATSSIRHHKTAHELEGEKSVAGAIVSIMGTTSVDNAHYVRAILAWADLINNKRGFIEQRA